MNKTETTLSDLRLASLAPNSLFGALLKLISPLLDRLLGIKKLRDVYESSELSGLDKQDFSEKLLQLLGVQISGGEEVLS